MYNFLTLQRGDNIVRILTLPHQYNTHAKHNSYLERLFCKTKHCLAPFNQGNCHICSATKNKPFVRWILGVISRKDGNFYLLSIDYKKFVEIRELARDTEWGNPINYDICIRNIYADKSISPEPKSPLTQLELDLQKSIDLNYITSLCKPDDKVMILI